jgi:hypothetical protein
MTAALRTDWLRDLLVKNLQERTNFPTSLPRHGQPLQIIHVLIPMQLPLTFSFLIFATRGIEVVRLPALFRINGVMSFANSPRTVAMMLKSILPSFYAPLIVSMSGRRLTELKGALIFAENWELAVIHLTKHNTLKAVLRIEQLRVFGSDGEATIGDPRDFNTYKGVIDLLRDPERRSYCPSLNPLM